MAYRTTTRVRFKRELHEAGKPITFDEKDEAHVAARDRLLASKAIESTGKARPGEGEAAETEV